jgi:hypothetical protein
MAEFFNIYCDESCHLEHDASQVMVLGAVWCPAAKSHAISDGIREIKTRSGLSPSLEIKWTKVSPAKVAFYLALVDYFFENNDLHFRGVLIPDKKELDHAAFDQSHNDWYYKMCFTLLEPIIDPEQSYCVYLDIKDTRSEDKRARLERVLRNSRADYAETIVKKVQQIRSHESELLQLTDLLIGAIGYANRGLTTNPGKLALIELIRRRSRKRLDVSTWLRESKFNLFRWTSLGGKA